MQHIVETERQNVTVPIPIEYERVEREIYDFPDFAPIKKRLLKVLKTQKIARTLQIAPVIWGCFFFYRVLVYFCGVCSVVGRLVAC